GRGGVAGADREGRRGGRGPAGEPTRDPTAARRGALLPFGAYKGFGLARVLRPVVSKNSIQSDSRGQAEVTSRPRARVPGTALRGLLRSHREHCRAYGLARLQVSMRLFSVFQRIGLLDLDLDRAREHHLKEILCHRREIGTGGSVGV